LYVRLFQSIVSRFFSCIVSDVCQTINALKKKEGAGPAFIIPADCRVLDMAWEITAVSSVGLNCYMEAVGNDSG